MTQPLASIITIPSIWNANNHTKTANDYMTLDLTFVSLFSVINFEIRFKKKKNASNVIVCLKSLNISAHYTYSINTISLFLMDCSNRIHIVKIYLVRDIRYMYIHIWPQTMSLLIIHITHSSIIITTGCRTIANNLGFNFNIVEENVRVRTLYVYICRRNDALVLSEYVKDKYIIIHNTLQQFAIIHRDPPYKYSFYFYEIFDVRVSA